MPPPQHPLRPHTIPPLLTRPRNPPLLIATEHHLLIHQSRPQWRSTYAVKKHDWRLALLRAGDISEDEEFDRTGEVPELRRLRERNRIRDEENVDRDGKSVIEGGKKGERESEDNNGGRNEEESKNRDINGKTEKDKDPMVLSTPIHNPNLSPAISPRRHNRHCPFLSSLSFFPSTSDSDSDSNSDSGSDSEDDEYSDPTYIEHSLSNDADNDANDGDKSDTHYTPPSTRTRGRQTRVQKAQDQ